MVRSDPVRSGIYPFCQFPTTLVTYLLRFHTLHCEYLSVFGGLIISKMLTKEIQDTINQSHRVLCMTKTMHYIRIYSIMSCHIENKNTK